MTLVVGLNFSHKLYLAGDTRVTRDNGQSRQYIENILKVVPLWGKEILDQKFFDNNSISLAVAGNVSLASYLYEKIRTALNNREISSDIRTFSEQILDLIQKMVDIWLKDNPHANCALLFSGMVQDRHKRISKQKLSELIDLYNERVAQDKPSREKFIKEILPNDPTWQAIDQKMRMEAGKSVVESLEEGDKPIISKWIQDAIDKNSDEIEMPDSLVLGIEIRTRAGVLKEEVAEWGEFIAYGASLTKDDLPKDLLAALELSHVKDETKGPHLFEAALISQSISDTAKKKGIQSIGGTVVLLTTLSNGKMLIQGKDLKQQDGKFVLELYNRIVPLIPFHKFPKPTNANLEMGTVRAEIK